MNGFEIILQPKEQDTYLMNFENNASVAQPENQWSTSTDAKPPIKAASSRIREKAGDEAGEKLAAEMKVFHLVANELKSKRNATQSFAMKKRLIFETATELFGVAPTWTAFYREILGGDGVARSLLMTPDETRDYEGSDEHAKVHILLHSGF